MITSVRSRLKSAEYRSSPPEEWGGLRLVRGRRGWSKIGKAPTPGETTISTDHAGGRCMTRDEQSPILRSWILLWNRCLFGVAARSQWCLGRYASQLIHGSANRTTLRFDSGDGQSLSERMQILLDVNPRPSQRLGRIIDLPEEGEPTHETNGSVKSHLYSKATPP